MSVWPRVLHVTTCIRCGWREATAPGNSYAPRCPNDGLLLDHSDVTIDTSAELADINRPGRPIR